MSDDDDNEKAADEELSELDTDELDDDALEDEDAIGTIDDDDDDDGDDDDDEEEEDEDDTPDKPRTRRRTPADDEDEEDEDLLAPDDVEADLDRILKDRMVTTDADDDDDDDDVVEEVGDRTEGSRRLQPKQADEQLCGTCFLLVRASAPVCPVGDDDCPIFS